MDTDFWKDILSEIVKIAISKYNFKCNYAVILDNHFHFLIQTLEEGGSISRIMQYIKSRFAERYNRIMNRKGAFWATRYKDKIVEFAKKPVEYLLTLIWYLGYNPVRAGKTDDPLKYRYSSFKYYMKGKVEVDDFLSLHPMFMSLSDDHNKRIEVLNLFKYTQLEY
jgi:REP element-mobilizing transposase RayT